MCCNVCRCISFDSMWVWIWTKGWMMMSNSREVAFCVYVYLVFFFGVVAFISEWIIIFFTQFRVVSFGRVFTWAKSRDKELNRALESPLTHLVQSTDGRIVCMCVWELLSGRTTHSLCSECVWRFVCVSVVQKCVWGDAFECEYTYIYLVWGCVNVLWNCGRAFWLWFVYDGLHTQKGARWKGLADSRDNALMYTMMMACEVRTMDMPVLYVIYSPWCILRTTSGVTCDASAS